MEALPAELRSLVDGHCVCGEYAVYGWCGRWRYALEFVFRAPGSVDVLTWENIMMDPDDGVVARAFDRGPVCGVRSDLVMAGDVDDAATFGCGRCAWSGTFASDREADGSMRVVVSGLRIPRRGPGTGRAVQHKAQAQSGLVT